MADAITIEAWEDDPVAAPLENQHPMNQPVRHGRPIVEEDGDGERTVRDS